MSLSLKYQQLKSITRAGDWRFSFIPHIFGNLYLWIIIFDISFSASSLLLLVMSLLTSFGFAALGYYINEYFDQEEDKKAGKINKLSLLNAKQKILVFIPVVLLTFLPWLIIPFDNFSITLIVLQVLLFVVYSIPLTRIKRVPIASGIIDAAYAYIVPMLLSLHSFYLFSNTENYFLSFIILYAILLLFVGFRNITIHQINDIFKDKKVGIKSLPMILGVKKSDYLLKTLIGLELLLFSVIAIFLLKVFSSLFMVSFIVISSLLIVGFKEYKTLHNGIIVNRPFRHLTDSIYQIWFPVISLTALVYNSYFWAIIIPIHSALLINKSKFEYLFVRVNMATSWAWNALWHLFLRPLISFIINNIIYFMFKYLIFVDLKKEKKSAVQFLKEKFF